MTYAELIEYRDKLQAAQLESGGVASVSMGDRTITYTSPAQLQGALNQVNRAIARHGQKAAGLAPGIRTASFNNG